MRLLPRSWRALLTAFLLACFLAAPVHGLINVTFTPVELVKSADNVVLLEGIPDVENKRIALRILKVLKGKDPGVQSLDVTELAEEEDLQAQMGAKTVTALLFAGGFQKAKGGGEGETIGALHLGAGWYGVAAAEGGHTLGADTLDLKAVWDGGSQPLLRAAEYVLSAKTPVIRATAGVDFQKIVVQGKLRGAAGEPSCTLRDGRLELLYASPAGDTLVRVQADGTLAVTPASSASVAACYVDLDQDGFADRVGCDGKRLYFIKDAGKPVVIMDLAATRLLPASLGTKPGLLALTAAGPVFVVKSDQGYAQRSALTDAIRDVRQLLMFDADGDRRADLVLLTDTEVLLAKGIKGAAFAAPARVARLRNLQLRDVKVADFDGDGCLDVLLAGADEHGLALLAGDGKGGFTHVLEESGELRYHGDGAMVGLAVGDFNNDGLPDAVLTPRSGAPRLMFNRGFRTFGFARNLDFGTLTLAGIDAIIGKDGPRAIAASTLVDLDGDGALDLLCVAGDDLVAVMRAAGQSTLGVHVRLADGLAGPVTVRVSAADRDLGAWWVDSSRPAFIGMANKGPLDLAWTRPDGTTGKERVIVLKATGMEIRP